MKRKARKDHSQTPDPEGGFNNPFAKLKSLAADLPPGPESEPAAESEKKGQISSESTATTPARVVIRRERKGRGGKEVTVVSHLSLSTEALESMLLELKSTLGVGGRREGEEIVLQGDQRDRVEAFFRGRGVKRISTS